VRRREPKGEIEMIIQVVKDGVWKINLRKSPHGKILDSFPLSQSLLMRISLDYLVNINDSKPWTMDVDTSVGKFKLMLRKEEEPNAIVPLEFTELIPNIIPPQLESGDDTFTREEPKGIDEVVEEIVNGIDPDELEMEAKKDGN
jgi:hypothetical protein